MIYEVANVMNVDPTELLTGEEPKMNSYTVTRSGQGVSVERYKGYAFESLAYNFIGRNKEPMIVTMYPNEKKPQLVTHGGQEFRKNRRDSRFKNDISRKGRFTLF